MTDSRPIPDLPYGLLLAFAVLLVAMATAVHGTDPDLAQVIRLGAIGPVGAAWLRHRTSTPTPVPIDTPLLTGDDTTG